MPPPRLRALEESPRTGRQTGPEVVSEFLPLERADAKDILEKLTAIFEKPSDKP